MPTAVPTSPLQAWVFGALSLVFFGFVLWAARRRTPEAGGRTDPRSSAGIILQFVGIALTGFGAVRPTLPSLSLPGILGTFAVVLLMAGTIGLFASSTRALGRNWSLVARTRRDHELVRNGPYAWVRHPIYLGMCLFLLAFATASGHWLQLVVAVPTFLVGTAIRMRLEDQLLKRNFGKAFELYRRSTPALVPKIL